MKIENQITVITGGASGLGQACVNYFLSRGATVVVWDKQIDKVAPKPNLLTIACDVSAEESVQAALAETRRQCGTPRICLNCAGVVTGERMVGKNGPQALSAFSQVIQINLIGTFNVMRLVAEAMINDPVTDEVEETGIFVNTASVAAFDGQIGQIAYSASKGGIVSMTLPTARELAQFKIRVNAIAPGPMATPMASQMPKAVQDALLAATVFPKRLGKPEEFAALAAHIVENPFINGEVIRLDGAMRLGPR